MVDYSVSGVAWVYPVRLEVRLVALAEPVTVHLWGADGEFRVQAVLLREKSSGRRVATLFGTNARGEITEYEVYDFDPLPPELVAVLSEITEGRWTR